MKCKEMLNANGEFYHIACKKGDVGRYVLLPGDPFRTDEIAKHLDNPVLVAHNREHKTWTGELNGVKVSVTSTGMGGPSAAIALEELIGCGADTFIRVGTCGTVSEESCDPSLEGVIVTGAVRDEGTTVHYIPLEYPAIADRHVVDALARAAKAQGRKYLEGIAQCKDAFYGQHDPDSLPNGAVLKQRWEAWKMGGVAASEMETAAVFVVSSIRRVRAGAVVAYHKCDSHKMNSKTIEIACDAIRILIEEDKENN